MTLGQILKEARLSKCMTQKQVGEAVGVAPQTISYYETDAKSPALSVLHKYCDVFGLDPKILSEKKYEKKKTDD